MASELDIFAQQGFGNRIGMGERPALLIIDFVNGFNDPDKFGGGNIDPAIKRTVELLRVCRERGLPVAHTRIVFADDGSDCGLMCEKVPALKALIETNPDSFIVPELKPQQGEYVIRKHNASAFFGTDLTSWLAMRGVDTVIIAGCVTSGCVRASAVDAMAWGFRPVVVADCVGDRAIAPHDASLFDLGQKYADVMGRDEVIAALASVAAGRVAAE